MSVGELFSWIILYYNYYNYLREGRRDQKWQESGLLCGLSTLRSQAGSPDRARGPQGPGHPRSEGGRVGAL